MMNNSSNGIQSQGNGDWIIENMEQSLPKEHNHDKEHKHKDKEHKHKDKHGHGHGHGHGGHGHSHGEKKEKKKDADEFGLFHSAEIKHDDHDDHDDHGHGHGHGGHGHSHGEKKEKKKDKHGHGHGHGGHDDHGHSHGGHGHGGHDDDDEFHDHDHDDEDSLLPEGEAQKRAQAKIRKAKLSLMIATGFTLFFMCAEIYGGLFIAHSLAILTDAAHLLTDVGAMLLSLTAMHLAERAPTSRATFGYQRAEILGALASVLTIWALVAILIYEAILRLISDVHHTNTPVDGKMMLIIGGLGLTVNVIDALILAWGNAPHSHSHGGGDDHGHSHGHGHGDEENFNVKSAFIHVLGDCIQSVGVMIAAGFIWWKGWDIADPCVSLFFGVITLFTTITLLRSIINVLMERVPAGIDYDEVLRSLENIDGVQEVHDLHIWSLSLGKICLSCHIAGDQNNIKILRKAEKVCAKYGIGHSTIQVDSHMLENCKSTCASVSVPRRKIEEPLI